jgi:hypothetical protein
MRGKPGSDRGDGASGGEHPFRLSVIAFACAMAVLVAGAWHYRQFMADDAFISLRYAERLLHGQGLTWSDGDVVEGYSNLLWVLGCALLGKLGLDLIWAARVLGFLGTAGAIAAIVWVHRAGTLRRALPGFAGGLALALCGPVVVWTVGGLEQPLLAGLLGWAIALSFPFLQDARPGVDKVLLPGFFLALVVLTRADGALFTLAACLGILAARGMNRESFRIAILLALVPLLFFIGQVAFRQAYYHEWLPNSAFAKVALTGTRVWMGVKYVAGGAFLAGILVPALLAFRGAKGKPLRSEVRFLGVMLAVWLIYVVVVGGDIFPARRHLVPAALILVYLASIELARRIPQKGPFRSTVEVCALSLLLVLLGQVIDPMNVRAYEERWEWEGAAIGGVLATAFGAQRPLLAVDPAGCVPYFSHLPACIDMLGINDHYLAHHRPKNFGEGDLGHELGNGRYVLSRKPDLVLFNGPAGSLRPGRPSGLEMIHDSTHFHSTFRPVTFECDRPVHVNSIVWVRAEGGAVGIRRSANRIQIPGYLFSANRSSLASLDDEGRLGVGITPQTPAGYTKLSVPPGTWAVRTEGTGGIIIRVLIARTEGLAAGPDAANMRMDMLAAGPERVTFVIPAGAPEEVAIILDTEAVNGARVREVLLERVGAGKEAKH